MTNEDKEQPLEFSMRRLNKVVKKMQVTGDCIIAVKSNTALAMTGVIDAMINRIEAMGVNGLVIVVDDLDDIRTFNEIEMNKAGWFHVEALRKIAHAEPTKEENEEEDTVH